MLTKLVPWLAFIAASISLIFTIRSYNTSQENLKIQQQTARPLTTIVRQGFFVQGDPPLYSYKLSYRNIGNQAADLVQVAVIALNHMTGKSNDIMMDFKANPSLNGEDKDIEKSGINVDKLFDFLVVCFRYQSPGGNPFAEEYYFRMPNNYRKGGGIPTEISHDDYDQLARHHVCQEQRYWFTPL